VMLVTGHARSGGSPPDWAALGRAAADGLTMVIYMGVAQAAAIREGLLRSLPADTPAAVVQHASLPQERRVLTTLHALCDTLHASSLGSPAVLIVGDVLRAVPATIGVPCSRASDDSPPRTAAFAPAAG